MERGKEDKVVFQLSFIAFRQDYPTYSNGEAFVAGRVVVFSEYVNQEKRGSFQFSGNGHSGH
jgi:hypothetical protein